MLTYSEMLDSLDSSGIHPLDYTSPVLFIAMVLLTILLIKNYL